jgi:hypothetical protein
LALLFKKHGNFLQNTLFSKYFSPNAGNAPPKKSTPEDG